MSDKPDKKQDELCGLSDIDLTIKLINLRAEEWSARSTATKESLQRLLEIVSLYSDLSKAQGQRPSFDVFKFSLESHEAMENVNKIAKDRAELIKDLATANLEDSRLMDRLQNRAKALASDIV